MRRNILTLMNQWKNNPYRKPLLLMGARQVGKTYVLHEFGRTEYENYVYIDFDDHPEFCALFSDSLDPYEIMKLLSIEMNVKIHPRKTLIIFDEVQACPNALNSLKYFCEKANEYHVCAAGSLLGVKLSHTRGFPVGKVNFLHLYPLSFSEFLDALGETRLRNYLSEIKTIEPISENFHEKLLRYFKIYLYIGGLPEAVAQYIKSRELNSVRDIHHALLNAYQLDFAKHAPETQIMRINQVWQCIPSQLAKENKKFIYSVIRKGARASEFETAIQWLFEAGLIYKTFNISTPKLPIKAYMHFDIFKLYLLDTGLLGAITDLSANTVIHGDQLFQEFRGAMIENYVAQVLAQVLVNYPNELYYWSSEGTAELDFVFHREGYIYPVEVKSGFSSKKRSLLVYADKYKPRLSIRCSPMNLKHDGSILNIPFYLMDYLDKWIEMV